MNPVVAELFYTKGENILVQTEVPTNYMLKNPGEATANSIHEK